MDALPDGTFPVGRPVKGAEIDILDEDMRPVAPGETGELCISGEGVSLGYLGNVPEQSNFTRTPDGRRIYRSGDLGYQLPDGNIAFLRRKDLQVMIKGRRVECQEVENVLCCQPEVEAAHVEAFVDDADMHYLVAYIVPEAGCSFRNLRGRLMQYLTSFMIPEFFISMPRLPLTPNGKIDRAMLPIPIKTSDIYE